MTSFLIALKTKELNNVYESLFTWQLDFGNRTLLDKKTRPYFCLGI